MTDTKVSSLLIVEDNDDLRELVLAREKVVSATADGIRTVIVRAPKLVNIVPV